MGRFTSAELHDAAGRSQAPFHLFLKIEFASGTRLFSTMPRAYTFDGDTYPGQGSWMGMSELEELEGVVGQPLDLFFSGNDEALVTTLKSENHHRSPASLFWAFTNPETDEPLDTPEQLFDGFVNIMSMKFSEQSEEILIGCQDEFQLWAQSKPGLTYTCEYQKSTVDQTDNFFKLQSTIIGKPVVWGKGSADIIGNMRQHAINTTTGGWLLGIQVGIILGSMAL